MVYYQEDLSPRELEDFNQWPDSARGLLATIQHHNMDLDDCYEICVMMAKICDEKTSSGAKDWLTTKIQEAKLRGELS